MSAVELLRGDCLMELAYLPDHSVDLCLTDPPYGTTVCEWDSAIPFEDMWRELKRVVKPNGVICLFGSEPFSSSLRLSNIKMFKYDWVWVKSAGQGAGFVNAKNAPIRLVETVSVFSRAMAFHRGRTQNRMTYYPQGLKQYGKFCRGRIRNRNFRTVTDNAKIPKDYIQEFTNYPTQILKDFNGIGKKRFHPTQKPVALLEYLIKTYTLEGETVLDFTMGSGSTGVACKNLNRNFIGIEQDEKYFEIAKKRIFEGQT